MTEAYIKSDNVFLRKAYRKTNIYDHVKYIIGEERKIYKPKKDTHALACKQIIILKIKNSLKSIAFVLMDAKEKTKILKIAEKLPFHLIRKNIDSINEHKKIINKIQEKDDELVCTQYINKKIYTDINKIVKKISIYNK